MPLFIAIILRQIIIWSVQLGLAAVIERYALPVLNDGIKWTMTKFGVSEETAEDIMANWLIQSAEIIGINILVWKTKIPIKVAERLRFTSKGYSPRKLTPPVEAKVKAQTKIPPKGRVASAGEISTIATETAKSRGLTLSQVKDVVMIVGTIIGVPTAFFYMLAQWVDFGNWPSGVFNDFFVKIFTALGLPKDKIIPSSAVLSKDTWDRVFGVYKELGIAGINDPYKMQTVIFSRQALIDLVDKVAANLAAEGGQLSLKNIIGATQALMIRSTATGAIQTPLVAAAAAAMPEIKQVKVFTGIVSQGTLGEAVSFTPRENDLIESIDELKQSAANNLAPFIASLPGKIVYEIKIVSSVVTKDGFRQSGTTQKVIWGYTIAGKPKYKTIRNKFATLNLYLMSERGSRQKITQITLGPTDAAKLQPTANEISTIEQNIKSEILSTDINDITGIYTAQKIDVLQPSGPAAAEVSALPPPIAPAEILSFDNSFFVVKEGFDGRLFRILNNQLLIYEPVSDLLTPEEKQAAGSFKGQYELAARKLRMKGIDVETFYKEPFITDVINKYSMSWANTNFEGYFTGVNIRQAVAGGIAARGNQGAATLYEWYISIGQSLPPVSERAKIYEQYGLGLAAYYTGTAEQNTKLLAVLKTV